MRSVLLCILVGGVIVMAVNAAPSQESASNELDGSSEEDTAELFRVNPKTFTNVYIKI